MIKSMTAYAGSETSIGDLTLNCELRSVNHRYCDITLKLPEHFRFLEADIRAMLTARLDEPPRWLRRHPDFFQDFLRHQIAGGRGRVDALAVMDHHRDPQPV